MSSFNGIGTTLYGKREKIADGSYITTKWFIVFLLPIVPLGSYRVWKAKHANHRIYPSIIISESRTYEMIPVKFNKKQIINTYLAFYGFIGVTTLLLYILN